MQTQRKIDQTTAVSYIKHENVNKTFTLDFFASLKQSNATQNIYFSNYIEWQGAVREKWFYECISRDMLQSEGVFVTKMVEQEYFLEGYPFQTIRCDLNVIDIQRCSFRLIFRFYIEDKLVGIGKQKIAFLNHEKRLTRLPLVARNRMKGYETMA